MRHLLLRRHLDGGVRRPEVAHGHDGVRELAQGRVHPVDARDDQVRRREVLGRPQADRRRLPVLPLRPGRLDPADVAGGLRRGQAGRRHRLPGRRLRGPDRRLPRAGLRGRRQGAQRRRLEVRDQLAGERQGAPVHGRRHQVGRPPEGRDDVHGGARAPFMRNWPYAYALGQKAEKVKGKFKVAPYPEFEGGGKAGILGGHNLVVSAYSKNPEGAVALIDYLTRPEAIKRDAAEYSLAPVLEATYDDPEVKEALPFADELKQAVAQAKPRPVSPVYTQISSAIYKNVNQALSGQQSPEAALKKADSQINQALETF